MTLETSFYDIRDLTAARDAYPRFIPPQRRESELNSVIRADLSSAAVWRSKFREKTFTIGRGSAAVRGNKLFLYHTPVQLAQIASSAR
jgi:hypothetical protein